MRLALFLLSFAVACAAAAQPPGVKARPVFRSATAAGVYSAARPRLLQIRTLVGATERQSSLGSGFLVSGTGLALTNYHVVSQFALEPETYKLEYIAPDGSRGALELLAFDVANDIAAVRLDRRGQPFFEFDARMLKGATPKGERLYSMGNPLDLGFTIVEGTYNGPVERSYNERIHFSGAINPGMSGGPTVSAASRIVGINVAKRLDGELVSFLVPARFAADLVARAADAKPLSASETRAELGRQLVAWQAGLYQALESRELGQASFGPYRAPEAPATLFTCWSRTNTEQVPKPRARVNTTSCFTSTSLFVAGDLNTGQIRMQQSYVRSLELNDFQFAAFLSGQYNLDRLRWNRKRQTRSRCHESFVAADADRPPLRAVWCARAYRDFEGLYDVSMLAVTQDRAEEALVTRLSLQGVAYDNALRIGRRFLDGVRVVR